MVPAVWLVKPFLTGVSKLQCKENQMKIPESLGSARGRQSWEQKCFMTSPELADRGQSAPDLPSIEKY